MEEIADLASVPEGLPRRGRSCPLHERWVDPARFLLPFHAGEQVDVVERHVQVHELEFDDQCDLRILHGTNAEALQELHQLLMPRLHEMVAEDVCWAPSLLLPGSPLLEPHP